MLKLYRANDGHPLNIAVWTDSIDENTFVGEISDAITKLVAVHSGISKNGTFALSGQFEREVFVVIQHSFEILCKLRGYKTDFVSEKRALMCGTIEPDDRNSLYLNTGIQSADVDIHINALVKQGLDNWREWQQSAPHKDCRCDECAESYGKFLETKGMGLDLVKFKNDNGLGDLAK
jgi:hypothetical protein